MTTRSASPRERIESLVWYHTFEFPDGIVTNGYYDCRATADQVLPADLTGKRCLDACSSSGFWAFEMERRGAREVVAIDVASYEDKDWQQPTAASAEAESQATTFALAKELFNSAVDRRELSVYDASVETLGEFDFVFIGNVLIHLRDPVLALRALRQVCRGEIRSLETVLFWSSVAHPRGPRGALHVGSDSRWWTPNAAAHRRWLAAAGFDDVERVGVLRQPFGTLLPRLPKKVSRKTIHDAPYWLGLRQFGLPSQVLAAR